MNSEAAEVKSEYPIAYAHAFCPATAKRLNTPDLTGDPVLRADEKIVPVQSITDLKKKITQFP
jgi:hypothetical protein